MKKIVAVLAFVLSACGADVPEYAVPDASVNADTGQSVAPDADTDPVDADVSQDTGTQPEPDAGAQQPDSGRPPGQDAGPSNCMDYAEVKILALPVGSACPCSENQCPQEISCTLDKGEIIKLEASGTFRQRSGPGCSTVGPAQQITKFKWADDGYANAIPASNTLTARVSASMSYHAMSIVYVTPVTTSGNGVAQKFLIYMAE